MSDHYCADAVVIGAGVIGAAVALELARGGRKTISVDRLPAAGYGSTSKMLGESAVCLAMDELTSGGGCLTPASAMGDALLTRLPANAGVCFDLED